MLVKTVLKYGAAVVVGVVVTKMLSEDTRKQIGKAADGVATDVKARAKKAGKFAANLWSKDIVGEGPKTPADPKPPVEPKDTPPPASA